MDNRTSIFFLMLVLCIYFFAISPMLFSEGMFYDGVTYATIARNMAEGIGNIWNPVLTESWASNFHDHPPLVFKLQSFFFTLFGDHHWVERIYSLSCYLIATYLIIQLWKQISPTAYHRLYWIPILLWITIPKMTWGSCNNLLENTLMLFVLASFLMQLKALKKAQLSWFLIAGFFLFLGLLSKGPTALFPLSLPFFYYVLKRSISLIALIKSYSLFLLGLIVPLVLLILLLEDAKNSLESYFQIQLIGGLGGEQSVDSRFYIIRRVTEEILTMAILATLILLLNHFKWKYRSNWTTIRSDLFVWSAIALSGVLPILISMKQSTFYAIPAFPLFAIVFALSIAPIVSEWIQKIHVESKSYGIFKMSVTLLFIISIIVLILPVNQIGRDKSKIQDIEKIIETVGEYQQIGIHASLEREWSVYAYFYRYGHVSLLPVDEMKSGYLISPKGTNDVSISRLDKEDIPLSIFDLYSITSAE